MNDLGLDIFDLDITDLITQFGYAEYSFFPATKRKTGIIRDSPRLGRILKLDYMNRKNRIFSIKMKKNASSKEKIRIISQLIGELISHGKRDEKVRKLTGQILRKKRVPAKDHIREVQAIKDWIEKNIRYTGDTWDIERLQTARRTLKDKVGDCDCTSILFASMMGSIGYPSGVVIVDVKGNGVFNHAMGVVKVPSSKRYMLRSPNTNKKTAWDSNTWLPIELTKSVYWEKGIRPPPLGWRPPGMSVYKIIEGR